LRLFQKIQIYCKKLVKLEMNNSYFNVKNDFYEKFEVRKLKMKDLDEITDFVIKFHTARNPFKDIFKMDRNIYEARDVTRVKEKLKYDTSFGCYEKISGRLVAVSFATIHDKIQEPVPRTDATIGKDIPALQYAMRFIQYMERDLYGSLNANRIMMTGAGAVHPDYVGTGIMPAMNNHLVKLGLETNCEYIVGVTVTFYSQRACEKMGLSVLREVKYADYIDPVTGKKPDLDLSTIHTHAKLFYYRLPSQINQSKL